VKQILPYHSLGFDTTNVTFIFQVELLRGGYKVVELLGITDSPTGLPIASYNYLPFVTRLQIIKGIFSKATVNKYYKLNDPYTLTDVPEKLRGEGFIIQNGMSPTHVFLGKTSVVGTAVRLKCEMDMTIKIPTGDCYDFVMVEKDGSPAFRLSRYRPDKKLSSLCSPMGIIFSDYKQALEGAYLRRLDPCYFLIPSFPIKNMIELSLNRLINRAQLGDTVPTYNPLLVDFAEATCVVNYPSCFCATCKACRGTVEDFVNFYYVELREHVYKPVMLSGSIPAYFFYDIGFWIRQMYMFGQISVELSNEWDEIKGIPHANAPWKEVRCSATGKLEKVKDVWWRWEELDSYKILRSQSHKKFIKVVSISDKTRPISRRAGKKLVDSLTSVGPATWNEDEDEWYAW
jgi:hypothetical protein